MESPRNSAKIRLAVLFSILSALAILGLTGWQVSVLYSGAQEVRGIFSSPQSDLEAALKAKDLSALKAAGERLFSLHRDLKAFRVAGPKGPVLLLTRHPGIPTTPGNPDTDRPQAFQPDSPWEEAIITRTSLGQETVTLEFLVTVFDPVEILEALKVLIFCILGVLLAALLVKLALGAGESPAPNPVAQEESTLQSENPDDLDFRLPPWEAPVDSPDLEPLSQESPDEEAGDGDSEEDFWIQTDGDMESEILDTPGSWREEGIPDLHLPPLELPPELPQEIHQGSPKTVAESHPRPTGPFDPETGAVWEDFLEARLESELRRAADNNQDLVIALVCGEDNLETAERRELRNILVETFPLKDLIFNRNDRGFTLLLPQKTLEVAMKDLDLCLKRKEISALSSRIVSGMSARSGRLLDPTILVTEAEKALEKAASGHESLIGFRADPEKYRNFLAKAAKE